MESKRTKRHLRGCETLSCRTDCPVFIEKTLAVMSQLAEEIHMQFYPELLRYMDTHTGMPYLALVLIATHVGQDVGRITPDDVRRYARWAGREALERLIERDCDGRKAAA